MASKIDKPLDDLVKENVKASKMATRRSAVKGRGGGPVSRRGAAAAAAKAEIKPFPSRNTIKKTPMLTTTKILVSNLHPRVNDADIRELFSQIGSLRKSAVHYNSQGTSLCTAEVVFAKASDVAGAIKAYNNLTLDGKPMKLSMIEDPKSDVLSRISSAKPATPSKAKPVSAPNSAQGKRGAAAKRGKGRGGSANGRRDSLPSQEKLDKELEKYIQD